MDADLQPVHERIVEAIQPEDLFMPTDTVLPERMLLKNIAGKYERLKAITDPHHYQHPADKEAAAEVDQKLERLYALAQDRIRHNIWGISGFGRRRPTYAVNSFDAGPNRYYVGRKIGESEHTIRYEAFLEREGQPVGEVMIKIAKSTADNSFLQTEIRNLDLLHALQVPQWRHLPFIMDRLQYEGRIGVVLRKTSGHTLSEIRQHPNWRNGVDQRHVAWMLDRLFSLLGYVHSQDIAHGRLHPDCILIQPLSHNALAFGWSGAVHKPAASGERVVARHDEFTAPEVKEGGRVGPWSDIYSIGKVMIWLLGGNPATNEIPEGVEKRFASFLLKLVKEDRKLRPSKAWELHDGHCRLKESLWGKKFLHFDLA